VLEYRAGDTREGVRTVRSFPGEPRAEEELAESPGRWLPVVAVHNPSDAPLNRFHRVIQQAHIDYGDLGKQRPLGKWIPESRQ
jgi:hypothetical protein